ncbi:hypothetical protein AB6D85_02200 [Vibrio splendidus]
MIHIQAPFNIADYNDLSGVQSLPPKIKTWLGKAQKVEAELKKNNKSLTQSHSLIELKKSLWRDEDLIEWLLKLSDDKCWYTEVKHGADYPEIEHFRPKKGAKDERGKDVTDGYYWLAFNLANYRLCKPMPNRKKGTYFPILDERKRARSHQDCHLDELPLFLDPLSPRDFTKISFNDNGKSVPSRDCSVIQKRRVTFTIKHFGLNHVVLNRRRKNVWLKCRNLYFQHIRYAADAERNGSIRSDEKAEQAAISILKMIHKSSEFSATARAALSAIGADTAHRLASSSGIDPNS